MRNKLPRYRIQYTRLVRYYNFIDIDAASREDAEKLVLSKLKEGTVDLKPTRADYSEIIDYGISSAKKGDE